jgi:hypothetical protein
MIRRADWLVLFLLISIATITHWQWFFTGILTTSGDWWFQYPEVLVEKLSFPPIWQNDGFGSLNISASTAFVQLCVGILAKIGISTELIVRIIYLVPATLCLILGSYFLADDITKSRPASFIAALVFSFNTYVLNLQAGQLLLLNASALIPIILLLQRRIFESKSIRRIVIAGLVLALQGAYDFRIFYITVFIIVGYNGFKLTSYIATHSWKNSVHFLLVIFSPLIIAGAIHFHWLLGISKVGALTSNEIFNRGLFGDAYMNIIQAVALFHPFWTGSKPAVFEVQSIPWSFFIIPIVALFGYLVNRKKPEALFFMMVALVGIFLTKQSSEPFTGVYLWLYEHFPGFNAFREASKFYILIVLGYSVLVALFFVWYIRYSKHSQLSKYSALAGFSVLLLLNSYSLVTGEFGTMFVARHIPADYLKFRDYMLKDDVYSRVLWVPSDSRWGFYSSLHPKLSAIRLADDVWRFVNSDVINEPLNIKISSILKKNFLQEMLNISSVKYLVVPIQDKDNDDDFYVHYGGRDNPEIRQWYLNQLDAMPFLKRADLELGNLVVYENDNSLPYIRSFSSLLGYENFKFMEEKYRFSEFLDAKFDFVEKSSESVIPTTQIRHLFENIEPENIGSNTISLLFPDILENTKFYANSNRSAIELGSAQIKLSPSSRGSFFSDFPVEKSEKPTSVLYQDYEHLLLNSIPNASFEDGLWKDQVGDCHNYDENPVLAMRLNSETYTSGNQSLQLEATRHIACTDLDKVPVSKDKNYLFSFDYQSPNGRQAGYYIGFDDTEKTIISDHLPIVDSSWHKFTKQIRVPMGASVVSVIVYSYPKDGATNVVTRYDNFYLVEIPDIFSRYFLVSDPKTNYTEPQSVSFSQVKPTQKLVHINRAVTPFYLAMSESFHSKWQAELNNSNVTGFFKSWIPWVHPDAIPEEYHFKLDGFLNGWYVDPVALCGTAENLKEGCKINDDGSYDIELIIEFTPQRWFYVGLIISGTTLVTCLGYLGYSGLRSYRNRRKVANITR